MPPRFLHPDEEILWSRVAATVDPLHKKSRKPMAEVVAAISLPPPRPPRTPLHLPSSTPMGPGKLPSITLPPPRRTYHQAATLDGHWDRRLKKGHARPDMSIDLHGHTLASAQALLEQSLARAIMQGARILLVVAGRLRAGADRLPMTGSEQRPRGAIRASLPDWLTASSFADQIVALRPAHVNHGGAGAVYIILRRSRDDGWD